MQEEKKLGALEPDYNVGRLTLRAQKGNTSLIYRWYFTLLSRQEMTQEARTQLARLELKGWEAVEKSVEFRSNKGNADQVVFTEGGSWS